MGSIKTLTAASATEALNEAVKKYGDKAKLVSTKEIRKPSALQPGLCEAVFYVEEDSKSPKKQSNNTKDSTNLDTPFNNTIASTINPFAELNDTIRQIEEVANINDATPIQTTQTKIKQKNNEDTNKALKEIINRMDDKIRLMQSNLWELTHNTTERSDKLVIPPEFAEIFRIAKSSEMEKHILNDIMEKSIENIPVYIRQDPTKLKEFFNRLLSELTPIKSGIKIHNGQQKIIQLIGPTGCGKSSMLTKITYEIKKTQNYKIGIINLDRYTIGANEQLNNYARILKVPFAEAKTPRDLANLIQNFAHLDLLFIDAFGLSHRNSAKLDHLKSFSKIDFKIEYMLVIPSNLKHQDLLDIYDLYKDFNISGIALTKLDETKSLGNVFSFLYECKKPLQYFSTGQNIPNDIMLADNNFFIQCLTQGLNINNDY